MPTILCKRCGGTTNTAVSDHIHSKDGKADRCFAKWDKEACVWVKGCAYDEADEFMQKYCDDLSRDTGK